MRKRRAVLVTGALAAVIAAGGTTAAVAADHNGHDRTGTRAARVDLSTAEQAARARVPGATVTEAEAEHEHGRTVWEFDLVKKSGQEYEVTVDASTGRVVSAHPDDDGGDGHHRGHHDHDDD